MNNDLISREALKKALGKSTVTIIGYGEAILLDTANELIDTAPTVEPIGQIVKAYTTGFDTGVETVKRQQGEWVVTAEDNYGVHRICCPFCSYEKGSNNTDHIVVTFTNFPKFCENCGADMGGGNISD